jgi:hypothetical protein
MMLILLLNLTGAALDAAEHESDGVAPGKRTASERYTSGFRLLACSNTGLVNGVTGLGSAERLQRAVATSISEEGQRQYAYTALDLILHLCFADANFAVILITATARVRKVFRCVQETIQRRPARRYVKAL